MADIVYGLLSTGLAIKPQSVVRDDLNTQMRALFGASIDVSDFSILGQILGIVSEALYLLWELAEGVNSSQDPEKATGAALDAISALTGTTRPPATFSTTVVTLTGTGGTVIPAGTLVRTGSTQQQFSTDAGATLGSLSAWVGTTPYAKGARATNAARSYQAIVGGTSAGSGGPTASTPGVLIVDGSVSWLYLGEGAAAADVTATATVIGVIQAFALDLNTKIGSVAGWSSVQNLLDAVPGTNEATDEALRTLRIRELAGTGKTTQGAIAADVLGLAGVTNVSVFQNVTDSVNIDGMPPHSVEVLVQGGADQAVLNLLFASVAAGIQTTGTTPGSVTDSQGIVHPMYLSRPTTLLIYVTITLTYDASVYAPDGDTLVKDAIATFGQATVTGKDVVSNSLLAQAFSVIGVLDVSSCFIGLAPSPTLPTTIPISLRQLAAFDSSRIIVVSTPAIP